MLLRAARLNGWYIRSFLIVKRMRRGNMGKQKRGRNKENEEKKEYSIATNQVFKLVVSRHILT